MVYQVIEHASSKVVWEQKEQRSLEAGANAYAVSGAIQSPLLRSPDAPNLYRFKVTIDGKESFEQRFGVREFTSREDGLYLNGEKFYMKAGFWEGLYPNGMGQPDSLEMLEKEIRWAKQAVSTPCVP